MMGVMLCVITDILQFIRGLLLGLPEQRREESAKI